MIVLRIILNVVVLQSPLECPDVDLTALPYQPLDPEYVFLTKPLGGTGCIIRYESTIELPKDFKGV